MVIVHAVDILNSIHPTDKRQQCDKKGTRWHLAVHYACTKDSIQTCENELLRLDVLNMAR